MFQNQNKLRQFEEEKNADNLQMASLLHNLEKVIFITVLE